MHEGGMMNNRKDAKRCMLAKPNLLLKMSCKLVQQDFFQ